MILIFLYILTLEHHRGFGFITLEHIDKVLEVLRKQPHYIKGMKIDCKIAIPKELLNNTDSSLGAKAKESICVSGNITDNNNCNNKSKLKKKHKGINDKQKHKRNTPTNPPLTNTPINLFQPILNTNANINTQCTYNITEPDNNNYTPPPQHIQNQFPYSSNNQQTSAQILNSSFQTSSSSTHSSKSTPLYLRKLFLGGLPPHITTEELINYFSKFGTVERVLIMTDKNTGRARGFGFLIFSHKETVDKIISVSTSHFLCGKWIECKRAHPKEQSVKMLSENNTSPSLNMNYNIDNDNLVLNDIVSNKSFSLSGDKYRNENNLFTYQNYIPKTQTKYFLNHNVTLSQQSGDGSIEHINQNFVNDDINVNDSSQKQFQYYFNNCIVNPSFQNYFHYKLFDKNGEDLSKLMLYKNSEKTTLFSEDYDKKNSNISNYNNNGNNTLSNINWVRAETNNNLYSFPNTHNAEYLYYDKHTSTSNHNVSNQSWIGNYFMTTNNNNTNIHNSYSFNHPNYNNNPLGIDSVVHPQQQHSLLVNYPTNPNAMYVNGNDVDVSSDFVDESEKDIKVNGNSSDDCYGPNIHKRTLIKPSNSNDSFRPY